MYLYMYMYICMMCLVHHMYNIQCVIMYTPIHYITLHYMYARVWRSRPSGNPSQPPKLQPEATKSHTPPNADFPLVYPLVLLEGVMGNPLWMKFIAGKIIELKWFDDIVFAQTPYLQGQSHGFPVDVPFKSTRCSLGLKNCCSKLDAKILDG